MKLDVIHKRNMKSKLLLTTLMFVLVFPDEMLACGGCYRKYLSYVEPYWSIYYKSSVLFGVITFILVALINKIFTLRFISSMLLFLLISLIVHWFATECMLGIPAFCIGILFGAVWPTLSYLTFMRASPLEESRFKPILIAAILLPLFVAVTVFYANNAKAESENYINSHLPKMLRRDYGVIINQYAIKQLLLIRDHQKIETYEPEITMLLESEDKLEKQHAQEILNQWAESTPN